MWLRQQLQNRNEAQTQIMTLESAKASIVTQKCGLDTHHDLEIMSLR